MGNPRSCDGRDPSAHTLVVQSAREWRGGVCWGRTTSKAGGAVPPSHTFKNGATPLETSVFKCRWCCTLGSVAGARGLPRLQPRQGSNFGGFPDLALPDAGGPGECDAVNGRGLRFFPPF